MSASRADADVALAAARRWADTWARGWEARDTDAIMGLYHPSAVYSTQPFRTPNRGRDQGRGYVQQAFDEEAEVRAWCGTPIVDGDRAAVQWWATMLENGVEVTLAGISILRFDADGLVIDQWDAWNQADGRISPPEGWGS